MEGQSELSYPTKRSFIILPLLLTFILPTLSASNTKIPIPLNANFTKLTYRAVPIFANTLITFNFLKSSSYVVSKTAKALEANAAALIAYEEAKTIEKVEVANKAIASTFSIATLAKEERRKFVSGFAASHIDWGFKYRYGGISVENGIDCSGFTRYVLNYFNIKTGRSASDQFEGGTKIPVKSAQEGDLVFFSHGKSGINHVAMVVSNDENGLVVVHSTTSRGIVKENITESSYWKNKLRSTAVNIIGL